MAADVGRAEIRLREAVAAGARRASVRHGVAALAALSGILAVLVAHEVFPYLSYNHDEAVYLQQAAMLLDGLLFLDPPGGTAVRDALQPWFFVAEGDHLYPKYAPVPAAMFAVGMVLGSARIALGLIAAAVVTLTYATVAEAFDRRTGLVAAVLLVATPLFLVQSAVFLPYLPTLAWLLLFAWAYLRTDRTGDARWAVVAGGTVGVAFFARPYTAVLFALPFVCHALWTIRGEGFPALRRQAITAALGLAGVGVTLGYNAVVTGDPLVFPYQAFSPMDGPGFGWRELWGHGLEFTPALSLESTLIALRVYASEWSVAPPLGVGAALVGGGLVARRGRSADPRKLAVGALALTIVAGHLYFWGTFNAIGNLDNPGFGLMGHLGPYYHLGLVVPTVAFGAHALVVGAEYLRSRLAAPDGHLHGTRTATTALAAAGVVLAAVVGGVAVASVGDVLQDNREVTEAYETAYDPIESADLDRGLVFLPTPHGPWMAHPFQYLHNGPDFDGETVYSQDRHAFDVLAAFPDRAPYRYSYRGEWVPIGGRTVDPLLQELTHVRGEAVTMDATLGLPAASGGVLLDVDSDAGGASSDLIVPENTSLDLSVTVSDGTATVAAVGANESVTVPVASRDTLDVTAFVDARGLDSFEYELALPVERSNGAVAAITPRQRVCTDVTQCDEGAAYVPGTHRSGITVETDLSAVDTGPASSN